MSKQLTLCCSQSMAELLADILRQYADAAYPQGGSECAQSARQSLLESADNLIAEWDEALQSTTLSKRLRVMAKAAVRYHVESLVREEDLPGNARQEYLLSVFAGELIGDEGYNIAQQLDRL